MEKKPSGEEVVVKKLNGLNEEPKFDGGSGTDYNKQHNLVQQIFILLLSNHKLTLLAIVLLHILAFHFDKLVFNVILIVLFCLGYLKINKISKF